MTVPHQSVHRPGLSGRTAADIIMLSAGIYSRLTNRNTVLQEHGVLSYRMWMAVQRSIII